MNQNRDDSPKCDAFGCEHCYGAAAEAMWGSLLNFARIHVLIDDSHLIVSIRVCPMCRQQWLQVFTELIDYEQGDDSQAWCLVPITPEESNRLLQQGSDVKMAGVQALGADRRYLIVVHPRGQSRHISWTTGTIPIFPHG